MKFFDSLFKSVPQRTYDEMVQEAGLDKTELKAVCELNLMGKRTGPREIYGIAALKPASLLFVPFDKSLPLFDIGVTSLTIVDPGSDELRFITTKATPFTAEYFKLERNPNLRTPDKTVILWDNEIAQQFFEKIIQQGATEMDRQQLWSK